MIACFISLGVITCSFTWLSMANIHKTFCALNQRELISLFNKGLLPVVQEIAGHSKIETTMSYTHTSSQQKIDAIEVLNSYY